MNALGYLNNFHNSLLIDLDLVVFWFIFINRITGKGILRACFRILIFISIVYNIIVYQVLPPFFFIYRVLVKKNELAGDKYSRTEVVP
jgi:hypothetical protein